MTKKEFLERLEHKLRVLSKEEIQDILNEYSGYLDNKIQEGKSEEEAVKDFGNLNDLASDILSAYKLNDNYAKDKVGGMIDNLVDVIMHATDSMTTFFKEKAPQMSVEDIVRLIIYVIIGLVLIAILKIPFSIIEGLLKGIVSWILPWFLAGPLRFIISIAINLIYFCIAIMLVANFIRTATEEKDFTLKEFLRKPMVINVDVRESLQSMFKKEQAQGHKMEHEENQEQTSQNNSQSFASMKKQDLTSEATSKDEAEVTQDKEEEPQLFQYRQSKESADYLDDPEYLSELEQIEDEARAEWKQAQRNKQKRNNSISSLFLLLLQIITCLVLFPFFIAMAGCSLAFGIGIFLLFSGAKIWGIVLVLAGLIGVISGFTSFLWKAVRPGSKRKKGRLISFLASIVIIGAGLMLSIVEFSQYETKTFSQFLSNSTSSVEKVEYLPLSNFETINFNYLKTPITTEVSPVTDNELELVFTLNEAYHVGSYYYDSSEISYKINDYPHPSQNFKVYKIVLASLKDQVYLVPSDSQDLPYSVKIRASQKVLDQLKIDGNIVTLQK